MLKVRQPPGAVFHAIWHMKKRLFGPGGVANPRDTTRYRCGLRLARTQKPSFLFALAGAKHGTRNGWMPLPVP
jgi:hypothetical protein